MNEHLQQARESVQNEDREEAHRQLSQYHADPRSGLDDDDIDAESRLIYDLRHSGLPSWA